VVYKPEIAKELAQKLLQIKALKVNVKEPFTWASGLKSPIYCDNRITLSYPALRKQIRFWLCDLIHDHFPDVEQIAAVATGGIAHGMAVADQLDMPFLYVRPAAKGHGLGKQIEGRVSASPTVVIEDLVSTGGSSLSAVRALRESGAVVLGLAALFSYELPQAEESFTKDGCALITLSSFFALRIALQQARTLSEEELLTLDEWKKDPVAWAPVRA